jgi:hypothetical protein
MYPKNTFVQILVDGTAWFSDSCMFGMDLIDSCSTPWVGGYGHRPLFETLNWNTYLSPVWFGLQLIDIRYASYSRVESMLNIYYVA